MTMRQLTMLTALAALWGASFLFIRIAVGSLGPVALPAARVACAGVALGAVALASGTPIAVRTRWREYLALGALASAIPFTLISAAEVTLTAGVASILNATPPLWSAIIAVPLLKEPLTGRLVIGLALALAGVSLVVGLAPVSIDPQFLLAVAAMLASGLCYAASGHYVRLRLEGESPLALATVQQLAAALLLAPAITIVPLRHAPSSAVLAAVAALALACTALAFPLYFRLLAEVGTTRAQSVTFLVPLFGVLWGALFLNERLRMIEGLGTIVLLWGVALVTGALPRRSTGTLTTHE
jgi:drug/metabolite transporter (DMT)-like permease